MYCNIYRRNSQQTFTCWHSFLLLYFFFLQGRIIVVVGAVADDARVVVPKMKICALRFTDTVRARILAAGGEIITFDQLALQRPTGSNTTLIRGRRTARSCYKYFGAAGVPNSNVAPKVASKGRKFEKARGARPSKGYVN